MSTKKEVPQGQETDAGEFKQIDVRQIKAPLFERDHKENIEKLQTSMETIDQLQNIVVKENGDGYQCISGWGRVLAQKSNGNKPLMAKVVDVDEKKAWLMMLAENICRTDMTSLEREEAVYKAIEINKCKQKDIAQAVSVSSAWISTLINAYKTRQELSKEDKENSSDLNSDVLQEIGRAPKEYWSNLIELINNKRVENNVKSVRRWVKKFNKGTDEDKERLLNGENPFPDKDKPTKPVTIARISSQIKLTIARISSQIKYLLKYIDISKFQEKKDKDRKAQSTNLKLSTSLLVYNMAKWEIITNDDRNSILKTLGIKSTEIKNYLE